MVPPMMEIRLIRSEEWQDLAPIFAQEGGRLPLPANAEVAVAYDDNGLAGFWMLQHCWHAGPLWIRPDHRGTGLWRKLHALIDGLFGRRRGSGYYSFSGSQKMEAVFQKLGYQNLGYTVWSKETK